MPVETLGSWIKKPEPPAVPASPAADVVLLEQLLFQLRELNSHLALVEPPEVNIAPPDLTGMERIQHELLQTVAGLRPGATAEEIADALAEKIAPPQDREEVLNRLIEKIDEGFKRQFNQMAGFGRGFGSSGPSNIASDATREIGRISNFPTDYAKDSSVDALEAKLDSILAELEKRPTYKVVNALITVPTGAGFTTVVEVTPSVATTVEGFAADLNSTTALTYRYRLITGTDATPTIIDMEQIAAGDNSKRALLLSVTANTRIAVQVNHADVVGQDFRATLNYREGP